MRTFAADAAAGSCPFAALYAVRKTLVLFFSTQSICLRSPFLKRILFPHHFGKNVISGLFAEFKSFRVLRNQRSQACFSVQFNHSSSLNENSLLSIMFLQN